MLKITLFLLATLAHVAQPDRPQFEELLVDDNVSIGYGLAIGDVDGDKKPDILLADKKQFVWYRNGDWKRFVMAEDLTASDNVCIAARDIDGDGRVEVAVGAQWNPGETADTLKSGAVYYLKRPKDPSQLWEPVKLHHEPVVHRMRWVKTGPRSFQLVVLPLHGRGNKNGEGKGVRIFGYEMPTEPESPWKLRLIDESLHMTHNLDVVADGDRELVYIGGREGVKVFEFTGGRWRSPVADGWLIRDQAFGEVRAGGGQYVTGIQPMHGNELTVYTQPGRDKIRLSGGATFNRQLLTDDLKQGHALATADLRGSGNLDIIVGWREPDVNGKVGVKVFVPTDARYQKWVEYWVDEGGMACEDLQVADLNGDDKPDIIAAGRATNNLKIYWNRN